MFWGVSLFCDAYSRYRGCFNTRISSGLGTTNSSSSSFFLNCRILIGVVVVIVVGNDKKFPLLNKSSVSRVGIIFAKKILCVNILFFFARNLNHVVVDSRSMSCHRCICIWYTLS